MDLIEATEIANSKTHQQKVELLIDHLRKTASEKEVDIAGVSKADLEKIVIESCVQEMFLLMIKNEIIVTN